MPRKNARTRFHGAAEPRKGGGASRLASCHTVSNSKLDINSCTLSSLRKLKIPVKVAQDVIRYRRKNKCITHINEVLRIKSVTAEIFKLLQGETRVQNSTAELRDILHSRSKSKSCNALGRRSKIPLRKTHSDPGTARTRSLSHASLVRSASMSSLETSRQPQSASKQASKGSSRPSVWNLWPKKNLSKTTIQSEDSNGGRSLSQLGSELIRSVSNHLLGTPRNKSHRSRHVSRKEDSGKTRLVDKWVNDTRQHLQAGNATRGDHRGRGMLGTDKKRVKQLTTETTGGRATYDFDNQRSKHLLVKRPTHASEREIHKTRSHSRERRKKVETNGCYLM